jgi:hypothetical protein
MRTWAIAHKSEHGSTLESERMTEGLIAAHRYQAYSVGVTRSSHASQRGSCRQKTLPQNRAHTPMRTRLCNTGPQLPTWCENCIAMHGDQIKSP